MQRENRGSLPSARHPADDRNRQSLIARANQRPQASQTQVLFATDRPAALAFMVEYGRRQDPPLEVTGVPLDAQVLAARSVEIAVAAVLVLDVADNPEGAIAVCKAVRKQRADLPILTVLCCERATRPWHVRHLVDLGVTSFLDARVDPAELGAEVAGLAAGRDELHLRLHQGRALRAAELFTESRGEQHVPLGAEQAAMVELVALGLSNTQIAVRLHLAPSTVHHHVADLCRSLRLPNRIALAAWAGANGYFEPLRIEPASPREEE